MALKLCSVCSVVPESLDLSSNDMTGSVPASICSLRSKMLNSLKVDCDDLSCSCCDNCSYSSSTGVQIDPRAKAITERAQLISFKSLADSTSMKEALEWITNVDEMKLSTDSEFFDQRYVLAVFYFSLGGNEWSLKGSWLSNLSHCVWHGVICDADGNIKALHLSKS